MRITTLVSTMALLGSGLGAQTPTPAAPPAPPSVLGFALTGSTTIGSQYIFRGLTQTDGRPTVQAELDLAHGAGFYLSVALSNISWFTDQNLGGSTGPVPLGSVASTGVEVDVFGGYKWAFAKDWTLDLGAYRYFYPGSYGNLGAYCNPNTTEGYLGLSYSWASFKYSRVLSSGSFSVTKAVGTSYLDLGLAIPLGASGWTVLAHGGKTTFSGLDNGGYDYTDFKLGIATELKGYTVTLAGTNANTKDAFYTNAFDRNVGKSRVALTIAKTF